MRICNSIGINVEPDGCKIEVPDIVLIKFFNSGPLAGSWKDVLEKAGIPIKVSASTRTGKRKDSGMSVFSKRGVIVSLPDLVQKLEIEGYNPVNTCLFLQKDKNVWLIVFERKQPEVELPQDILRGFARRFWKAHIWQKKSRAGECTHTVNLTSPSQESLPRESNLIFDKGRWSVRERA